MLRGQQKHEGHAAEVKSLRRDQGLGINKTGELCKQNQPRCYWYKERIRAFFHCRGEGRSHRRGDCASDLLSSLQKNYFKSEQLCNSFAHLRQKWAPKLPLPLVFPSAAPLVIFVSREAVESSSEGVFHMNRNGLIISQQNLQW